LKPVQVKTFHQMRCVNTIFKNLINMSDDGDIKWNIEVGVGPWRELGDIRELTIEVPWREWVSKSLRGSWVREVPRGS
jgi:hypothetical protein